VHTASFSGLASETSIEIMADRPTKRSRREQLNLGPWRDVWMEEGPTIGSHPGSADALTLEQLYDRCEADVLSKDPAKNHIIFGLHPDGVLAYCEYAPKNCADDCSSGVSVSKLEFLK
jgi:hypothetical protein